MDMGFGDLLSTAMTIVAIATLAGMGYFRGTITNLRDSLRDTREELAQVKVQRDEERVEHRKAQADLDALTRVVTGEVHWVAIGDKLDDYGEKLEQHNVQANQHWQQDEALLKEIRDILLRRPLT